MPSSKAKKTSVLFAIRCDSESGMVLSSELEVEAWNAIETLAAYLIRIQNTGKDFGYLFSWRHAESYLAKAKETYAWRGLIDSIKENDLSKASLEIEGEGRGIPSQLIKSKPIMLRVAGEVTNALIHSYNNQHPITFYSV